MNDNDILWLEVLRRDIVHTLLKQLYTTRDVGIGRCYQEQTETQAKIY